MQKLLSFLDRTNLSSPKAELVFQVAVAEDQLPLREIIRRRVFQEVERYNQQQGEYFLGLVQPSETELTLNGYRMRKPRLIDSQKQYAHALQAFEKNGFIVLVNDAQVDDLDAPVAITPETKITFWKLVPLVGG